MALRAQEPAPAGTGPTKRHDFGVPERTIVGTEKVTVAAGSFETTHVRTQIDQISSGTTEDEWFADGLPLAVKVRSVTGSGALHYVRRDLVKVTR